jgi:L-Ala-D/L-Glu epimerase
MSVPLHLTATAHSWPMAGTFRIAHGARTSADVVIVTLTRDGHTGRGECVPYQRYGETVASVLAQMETVRSALETGIGRDELQGLLPAGAARNGLDLALWDLEAKTSGRRVWELAGLAAPVPVPTAFTIVIDTPDAMASAASAASGWPLLKVKLGVGGDLERLRAVSAARPDARLIVDGNEGMDPATLPALLESARDLRIDVVEQPLPDADPRALRRLAAPVAICADESFHTRADIERVVQGYDAVNIKLDKTGGLTEALACMEAARAAGLSIMVGCMVSSSLAMAPATLLAQSATWTDLDGPLLLASDCDHAIAYADGRIGVAARELWG